MTVDMIVKSYLQDSYVTALGFELATSGLADRRATYCAMEPCWVGIKQNEIIIQSTLDISTSLISNNRLSRCENLAPVLTRKSNNM